MSTRGKARVAVVVQARMSSTRLPGKVLTRLGPATTLELIARRLEGVTGAAAVAIATSTGADDDRVADNAEELGLPTIRGPLDDVLERYRLAGEQLACEGIVRITADCPLVEPAVVDRLISMWREDSALDYAWNARTPRTFPDGLDVEVVSRSALEAAARETSEPYDREHVTPFVRDRPERFPQRSLRLEPPARAIKLSLDTPEDLEAIRAFLERAGPDATLAEIAAAAGGSGESEMVAG